MSEQQPLLYEAELANGLHVVVRDVTRHYFGGYWQVALEVSSEVPLDGVEFTDDRDLDDVRRLLGETVVFVRRLEKMAVPGDERDAVRAGLLERCERHLLPFLASPQFPARFIRAEYAQRRKKSLRGIPCLV